MDLPDMKSVPAEQQLDDRSLLWARRIVVGVTAAAVVMVVLDVGGPARGPVTMLTLLVAPGFSASLSMPRMSLESRILLSVVGSTGLLTLIATTMAVFGIWSPTAGLMVVAVLVIVLVLVSFRTRRRRT